MKKTFKITFYLLVLLASTWACKTTQMQNAQKEAEDSLRADKQTEDLLEKVTTGDTLPNVSVSPKRKPTNYNPEKTKKHDLLHTKLEVRFDWAKRYLYGKASLTLKPYFYPQNILVLDAKGFDISAITMNNAPLKYTYDQRQITIELGKTFQRNEKYTIDITYTAKPDELPKGGSAAITSDKGLYFINPDGTEPNKPTQIWTQGETESSSCWFPTIDSPNEKTTQEIFITVDKKYKTLSNGLLISSKDNNDGTRTDYWKMDLPHAPYLFMMAIGDFAVIKDKWRNIELSYWVEPEYAPYAKSIFGNTPEMIEFFSQKLKYPYPWSKYAQVVVRDYVSGAMENTTASIFMEALQMEDKDLIDNSWDFIIAHELFHQWFGDLTTCESWANLPLNEAFANYAEYLWAEYKYGKQEADYIHQKELEGYLQESKTKEEPLIRFHYKDREETFDAHSYNKGGRILHLLRQYVGEEAFWESLNLFLTRHKFQAVEAHQLRLCFEEVTGEDLNWFFNQWFFEAGHPRLEVSHTYQEGKLNLSIKQTQDTLSLPIFRLPVQVAVWVKGKKEIYPINITKAQQNFEFTLSQAPDLVLFDEQQSLLAEVKMTKKPEEYKFQFDNYPNNYLARHEALTALVALANSEEILTKALQDNFWSIRLTAFQYLNSGEIENFPREKVADIVKKIALSDKKTSIRAEAIKFLATIGINNYKEVLIEGLKANSNLVIGTALTYYLESDAKDIADKIKMYEGSKSNSIQNAVAEYYIKIADNTKYDWFVKRIQQTAGMARYQNLQTFGKYLSVLNMTEKQKGAKFLEQIVTNIKEPDWAKFAAYQALGLLKDVEGVVEMRKRLRENEKNEELKRLYLFVE